MKLEKHRYDNVVILKFTGEFDTFNLPGFSARIDTMIDRGDNQLVLDLFLLKFINSAALGYLIKTSRTLAGQGGEMVLARPSKFVKRTLSTLGLDGMFKIFESVEDAVRHFLADEDVGELKLDASEYDEALTGAVPILFRPRVEDGEAPPNQVGRIVTLYEDGLLFRYERDAESDPVAPYLKPGASLKVKFRQPFAVKDYYFEMAASVVDVTEMAATDEDPGVMAVRVRYDEIKDDDREHLGQFVRDQESWKAELTA